MIAARLAPAWLRGYQRRRLRPDDMLADLGAQLARMSVELRLAAVRPPALAVLRRAGVPARVRIDATIDEAICSSR
jgi:hypothetical protein